MNRRNNRKAKQTKPKPNMEEVLQYISVKYVKVDKGRKKSANPYLSKVLFRVTNAMKKVSPLFKTMFETFLYAGSSYDGLKIGKPDEFDIDLKLYLPDILDVQVHPSDRDGFVYIELKNWDILKNDNIYSELKDFMDDQHYLSQEKIKGWMQSIVDQAINNINDSGTFDELQIRYIHDVNKIKPTMSGPAVTLHVINSREEMMTIDLVSVFRIPGQKWPAPPVRQNISTKYENYIIVPKPPKVMDHMSKLKQHPQRYWRLSFPEQELDFMNDYNFCKPALRFLKKLRDTRKHNIPSYFIKTIFLWEIEKRNKIDNQCFWRRSATDVFLEMLKIYKTYIENHEIRYFWAEKNNFLQPNSGINISNISDYLEIMINDIDRTKDTDATVVAKYLLPTKEYQEVRSYFLKKYNYCNFNIYV